MAPNPRLFVLTGAGISADSGLRTYRGPDGLHADGKTIIMVTHDEAVAGHAERVVRLVDGRIDSERRGRG